MLRRAPQRRRSEPRRANVTRELIERRAAEVKRRAFAFVDETDVISRVSLVELGRLASGWTAALQEQGVRPGDRVVVLADSNAAWCGAVFGALKAGAIAVPCPPSLLPGDLAAVVRICEARRIVASASAHKIVATIEAAPPPIWLEEVPPADRELAAAVGTFETVQDDIAMLLPVWGADGSARLAAHTHDSTLRGASRSRHWLGAGRRDRVWCTAEPGSPEFVMTVFGAWAQGAEVVLHEPLDDPAARLEMIELLRVTVLVQSAGEYGALASVPGRKEPDLTGVREAVCLGDPVPAPVHAAFHARFDVGIRSCYGRPESGIVAADQRGTEVVAGSVGVPLPGSRVGVIDEQGAEVEPGEAGDLAIRDGAPGLFAGYWDDRNATEGAFRGTWFLTGDLAVREADDAVRLAFPAEVRALDDRRRAAAEERELLQLEELRLQQVRQEEELRRRKAEEAQRLEDRRLREEERRQKAAERAERDRERAAARRREEQERRRVVELEEAAIRRRQAEEAARRAERDAQKAAQDRADAEQRKLAEARAREEQQQRERQEAERARLRELEEQERREQEQVRRAEEAVRRRAEEERKQQEALERERVRARLEEERRREQEARRLEEEKQRAEEAERQRIAEARRQQEALERERAQARAEEERRRTQEARRLAEERRRAEEAERKRAEEVLRRQEALAREQAQARAEEEARRLEEARRAEEAARARAEEELKRQEALLREQARARAEVEKREREEARRAEEAERRRVAEERKRQQAIEREQERLAAEARRREEAEEKKAAEAERRRAEETRKRQEEIERGQAGPRRPRLPTPPIRKRSKRKGDEQGTDSIVTRIGAYGIEPSRPQDDDTEPNDAA